MLFVFFLREDEDFFLSRGDLDRDLDLALECFLSRGDLDRDLDLDLDESLSFER